MSMLTIITTAIRRYWNRAFNNGEATDWASLDAQLADLVLQGNQNKARLEAISTPAGSLRYSLTQAARFTATAGQTSFVVAAYDNVNDLIAAYTNSGAGLLTRIDDSLVTRTDSTHITLPAQVAGATVIIDVRSVGNGTSQLASAVAGQGSALVGYANGTGLGTQVNVQGALDELYTDLNSAAFLAGILVLTGYLKADGSIALTGNLNAGTKKVTNLGAGTAASNDAARMADITPAALKAALGTFLNASYVPLTGGVTMTGTLDFGNNQRITGLLPGAAAGQPITFDQLGALFGANKNAVINGAGVIAQGQDYVASVSGTYGYGKVELTKGALTGTTVAGTLTQGAGLAVGATGKSIRWSAVTTTGAGVAIWRHAIEDINSLRFRNQFASLGFKFLSDALASVSLVANIYKPTTINGFGTLTLIATSPVATALPGTELDFTFAGIAMGDCANGIMVEIVATIGAVANKNFDVTDLQFELGPVASAFEYESASLTLLRSQRYFYTQNYAVADTVFAVGFCTSTTRALIPIPLPVPMYTTAGHGVTSSAANQFSLTDGTTAITATAVGVFYNSDRMPALAVDVAAGLTAFRPIVLTNKAGSTPHLDFDARMF